MLGGIQEFAKGTNYADGGLSIVGEHGPELLNIPRGSQVKTASETRSLVSKELTPPKQPNIIQIVTPDKREIASWLVKDLTEMQELNIRIRNMF